jgi:hypothetical protein
MSQASNTVAEFLTDNPRWIGVLFAAFMLLNSSGTAVAAFGDGLAGP